jgi:hypothetical protein
MKTDQSPQLNEMQYKTDPGPDTQGPEDATDGRGMTRNVPLFCALRAGQTKPDALAGSTLDEVMEQVQRQVRVGAGHVPIVYIYQLIAAERYVPHSETLTVEQVQALSPQSKPIVIPGVGNE